MKPIILVSLFAGITAATVARGQVPGIITYQGRVTSNGTNFGGAGQFRFALLNGATAQTLWSNDGVAPPAANVSVSVADGLFTVALGDTSLANMSAIPMSIFTNNDVRLRIWFNNGVNGLAQLTPDQRITSVGYAGMSGTVPDGAITTTKLASGVLAPANFPPNSVSSTQLGDTIALGAAGVNGHLDIFSTPLGGPAWSIDGAANLLQLFGDDGSENARLWGSTYGELVLRNSLVNNAVAVNLSAQGASGGQLTLNNTNGASRALLEGENTGGRLTLYQANGSTAIYAEAQGGGYLDLRNTSGQPRLVVRGDGSQGGALEVYEQDGTVTTLIHNVSDAGVVSVRNSSGVETGYLWGRDTAGQTGGQFGLKQSDGTETVTLQASEGTSGGQLLMRKANGTVSVQLDAEVGSTGGGYLDLRKADGSVAIVFNADTGRTTTPILEITGGSDLSEHFNIATGTPEPGMIVSIDPAKPGELVLSTQAYDKKVAGIISGAGGVKPGMLMGQRGSIADGKHPVALTGRVYCWMDADAGGAIEPGDPITTSATPGHGMKAGDRARATGAILGKAMTALADGKGLVLVLVTLQ